MRLYNFQSEKPEEIEDNEVENLLLQGSHGFIEGDTVHLENYDGDIFESDAKSAADSITRGERFYIGEKEYNKRKEEEKFGTAEQELKTIAEAVPRSLSLGLSDAALINSGLVEKEALEGRKRVNKDLALGAEAMTTLGTLAMPGKAFEIVRRVTPLGIADKLAYTTGTRLSKSLNKVIEKTIKGDKLKYAAKVGAAGSNVATQAIIDSTAVMSGDYITDVALGNKEFTAEDYGSRLANNVLTAGTVGYLLGSSGKVTYDTIKKVGQEAFNRIMGMAKKTVDIKPEKYELNPNLTELKLQKQEKITGRPVIKTYIDPENRATLIYEDGAKYVEFDLTDLKLAQTQRIAEGGPVEMLLDIDNPSAANAVGKFLGIENLGLFLSEKTIKTKGFAAALEEAVRFMSPRPKPYALGVMARAKKGKNAPILKQAAETFRRRDALVAKINELGNVPSYLIREKNIVQKRMDELVGAAHAAGKRNKSLSNAIPTKKQISEKIKNFERKILGYRKGDDVFITNPEILKSVGKRAYAKHSGKLKTGKVPDYAVKGIRWASGQKQHFRNYSARQLVDMWDKIKVWAREIDGKKEFLPDFEVLAKNANMNEAAAINMMNDAVIAAENIIMREGLQPNLTASQFADYIEKRWIPQYLDDSTGLVLPTYEPFVRKLQAFANNFRKFVKDKGAYTAEANMTVSQLRKIRSGIDDLVDQWHGNKIKRSSKMDLFRRDIRFKMEDTIMKAIGDLPNGAEIVNRYMQGKKLYSVTQDVMGLLENEFARSAANNSVPITAIGLGIGGAEIGSAGGPIGALAGGMAAAGARTWWKNYGDYFYALTAEKLAKSNLDFLNKIDVSVSDFINKPLRAGGVAMLQLAVKSNLSEQYQDDKKEIENISEGLEVFIDDYEQKNGMITELDSNLGPQVFQKGLAMTSYLTSKFPKSPYPDYGNDDWRPSDDQILQYARYKQAVLYPRTMLQNFKNGYLSAEEIEVMKTVYPALYEKIYQAFTLKYKNQPLDYKKRVMVKKLFNIDVDRTTQLDNVMKLQGMIQQQKQRDAKQEQATRNTRQVGRDFSGQQPTRVGKITER